MDKIKFLNIEYWKAKKDFVILTGFMIAAGVLTTIVMDILVTPLTEFAKKNTTIFNSILIYSILFLVVFTFIYKVYQKISYLKKTNTTNETIAIYLLIRPIQFLLSFFIFILIIAAFISIIYFLLNGNDILIRTITKS